MIAPLWLGLLLLAVPVIALWLQRPPARALRVSALLLARALGGASPRRAPPSWLTLLQLALVLGALGALTAALVGQPAEPEGALALLRTTAASPVAPPASLDEDDVADALFELSTAGLRQEASGAPAVERALSGPPAAPAAERPPATGSPRPGDGGFAADALDAQVAAERAVVALRSRCLDRPALRWRGLDAPAADALRAAGCPSAGGYPPPSAPLQLALGRLTGPLGELELAVAVAGDGPHTVAVSGAGLRPTTATIGQPGALGWTLLRLDLGLDADALRVAADAGEPAPLAAPTAAPLRVALWTGAPTGPLARALGVFPGVSLRTLGPGEISDQPVDLLLLAAAPGLPLPAAPVRASLGADPAPLGGGWLPRAPGRGPLRVAQSAPLLNYTAARTEAGATVPGLQADGQPTLRLGPDDRALWLSPTGPILAERDEGGQYTAFLSLSPEAASPAELLPLLHLVGNLVDRAAQAERVASLTAARAQPWAQALPQGPQPLAPPDAPRPAGARVELLGLAAALLLAQGLVGRFTGGASA